MDRELIHIGTLTRPHGIKGEIRVDFYADSLDLLRGEVFLQAGEQPPHPAKIESVRLNQGIPLVRFAGVSDRTVAEGMRGQSILVKGLPELVEQDDVYLNDLIGLPVFLEATGERLGVLNHFLFLGEQETWVILTSDDREVYLPAVPAFIADIDLENERIRITPPEGLLELYLS